MDLAPPSVAMRIDAQGSPEPPATTQKLVQQLQDAAVETLVPSVAVPASIRQAGYANRGIRFDESLQAFVPANTSMNSSGSNLPTLLQSLKTSPAACSTTEQNAGLQQSAFALELFGGSARLTKCLMKHGLPSVAIDWKRNASKPEGPSILLDLTTPEGQQVVISAVKSGRVKYIHAAPPCGTASRSREIPIPQHLKSQGVVEPVPLRSDLWPEGLPTLEGLDKLKTDLANSLYAFTGFVLDLAHSLGIRWSCENPWNSIFWLTKWIAPLALLPGVNASKFPNCLHGGKRPKWSKLLHWVPFFVELSGVCPGVGPTHVHLPWGLISNPGTSTLVFATASEAAYPELLCDRMAEKIVRQLKQDGVLLPEIPKVSQIPSSVGSTDFSADKIASRPSDLNLGSKKEINWAKAEAGRQPRGSMSPNVIPEFRSIFKLMVCESVFNSAVEGKKLDEVTLFEDTSLPKGAKIVRKHVFQVGSAGGAASELGKFGALFFGMPWDERSFMEAVLKIEHPVDSAQSLDKESYRNIFECLTSSKLDTRNLRKFAVDHYTWRAKELEADEAKLHASLSKDFQAVLSGKRFLLFKEMLADFGHKDALLHHRMISGFQVTGTLDSTHVFKKLHESKKKESTKSTRDLMVTSKWSRQALLGSLRSSGDQEIDKAVYDGTVKEGQLGWSKGPLSQPELSEKLGPLWIASRRFGVDQGLRKDGSRKIRSVDDLSEYGVNSTVSVDEKVDLGGIDQILATGKTMASAVAEDRSVKVPNGSGGFYHGKLHDDWSLQQVRSIMGRPVDLEAAYKN